MICTSIQNRTLDEIFAILESGEVEMAEIRLDRCNLAQDEVEELFSSSDVPLIATCRVSEIRASLDDGNTDDRKLDSRASQKAESLLITAIHAGAAYTDLEIEAPAMMSKRIRRETRECGTVLIRSYHDFSGTDSLEALKALTEKCFALGADIAKIVVTANDDDDSARVLKLYESFDPGRLVAFAMGEKGRSSRIDCLAKGAPHTYAALNEEEAAAPGQMSTASMRANVYGDRKFIGYPSAEPVQMPCSKSFAQRAIIAAALSEGVSVLRGYSPCGDNESAIAVARALGAEVTVGLSYASGNVAKDGSALTIKGIGAKRKSLKLNTLHTGESGLLTRMMIPLLSVLNDGDIRVTGEKTLTGRPLKGAPEIMSAFGVRLVQAGERAANSASGPADAAEVFVPLDINGSLNAGKASISGISGSQIISGLLMALPLLEEDTVIELSNPKSIPYLFITMDVMKAFGVKVWCDMEGGEEFAESKDWSDCTAITFHIKGGQAYKAADMDIEGDWSSAANFLVAGAVFGRVELTGLDTKSLQADLSIMDILMEAGASLSQMGDDDPKGLIHVQRAPLSAFEVDAANCPDLFPIVAVLAAFCEGTSKIAGVGRLANKESDRGKAILEMLTKMGVNAKIAGDKLIVEGHSLARRALTHTLLRGGNFTSHHDHRMVMALRVAGIGADSPIEIDDTQCVAKSFPTFGELFGKLF
ncbi:MAG: type I 3-dehydroquinate dehydratase [Bacteroidales bacterium]|nr:type I 3-dehydroquinate dehydratase [Bacteroidales bacterium]MDY5443784.1 type I 3-dehydroquinate dehydratase [Candidatus Cryptobacteroides sp.]